VKNEEILYNKILLESRMVSSLKNNALDLYYKFETPIHIILYVLLITSIIYVKEIPDEYKYYGNNTLLRIIFFFAILGLCNYVSYVHSLLLALFVVLYISFTPGFRESFQNQIKKKVDCSNPWWDEIVSGRCESELDNENVNTQAPGT